MQRATALPALLLAALSASAAGVTVWGLNRVNPVSRVVELLKDLSVDIEKEAKTEERLYDDFKCWAKTVISAKTESNTQAQSRVDQLKTYIADLDAGRIELTSERTDLEKEIEQLSGEIELATETRKKEESEFEDAKAEMDKAIAALTSAVEVLRVATTGHEQGTLLAVRSRVEQGSTAHAMEASSLARAADLGDRFLTKGDALFLRRLLTGEVPEWDWEKLNRRATFKESYQARSFKIQDVLAKLLETFATNLAEATKKEEAAKDLFNTLMTAKKGQRDAAQEALAKLSSEGGAKALSKAEAEQEVASLTKQVTDDTSYIQQVTKTLEDKTAEWKERSETRRNELSAISKAIAILHSDDARGLFKRSFKSQGYSLLQVSDGAAARARHGAVEALRAAARAAHDSRLSALATLASAGHFDEVVTAIDNMIGILNSEEEHDLKTKEDCETQRATDSRAAILAGRAVDEMSETVASLQAEVAEIERQMSQNEAEVTRIENEKAEATKARNEEHAEFLVAQKEDQDAAALVERAIEVLAGFYESAGATLFQRQQQPDVRAATVAGAAPPPPPSTWQAPYAGKQVESTSLVAILEMVVEDIHKDEASATQAENAAQADFEKMVTSLDKQKDDLTALTATLSGTKGEKLEKVEEVKGAQRTKKGELDAVLQRLKAVEPGCDYFTVNFNLRTQNRHAELDGLHEAKHILQGAVFAEPEDTSRELRPGDALVQRSLRRKA